MDEESIVREETPDQSPDIPETLEEAAPVASDETLEEIAGEV